MVRSVAGPDPNLFAGFNHKFVQKVITVHSFMKTSILCTVQRGNFDHFELKMKIKNVSRHIFDTFTTRKSCLNCGSSS